MGGGLQVSPTYIRHRALFDISVITQQSLELL